MTRRDNLSFIIIDVCIFAMKNLSIVDEWLTPHLIPPKNQVPLFPTCLPPQAYVTCLTTLPSFQVHNAFEVGLEEVTFMAHHLTMLNWFVIQLQGHNDIQLLQV